VTFRRKIYQSLDELQKDLDPWLHYYKIEHTPQVKCVAVELLCKFGWKKLTLSI
jgi:hypothetical protein